MQHTTTRVVYVITSVMTTLTYRDQDSLWLLVLDSPSELQENLKEMFPRYL